MDELELLREAAEDVPLVDEFARARARQRLATSIEQSSRVRAGAVPTAPRRRLITASAAALVALLILVVQAILPPGPAGLIDANAALIELGITASSQPTLVLAPTEFVFVRSVGQVRRTRTGVGGADWTYILRINRQVWLAADGSGRIQELYSDPAFVSEADEAAWRAAGSPQLIPMSVDQVYGPGDLVSDPFEELPRTSGALESMIRGGLLSWNSSLQGPLGVIAGLLGESPSPPGLRRALFEVAAQLPGLTTLERAVDSSGRMGVGVAVVVDGIRTELVFDPDTSELLGVKTVQLGRGGEDSLIQALSYELRKTVGSTHERPTA